jgi:hypothetical protein
VWGADARTAFRCREVRSACRAPVAGPCCKKLHAMQTVRSSKFEKRNFFWENGVPYLPVLMRYG